MSDFSTGAMVPLQELVKWAICGDKILIICMGLHQNQKETFGSLDYVFCLCLAMVYSSVACRCSSSLCCVCMHTCACTRSSGSKCACMQALWQKLCMLPAVTRPTSHKEGATIVRTTLRETVSEGNCSPCHILHQPVAVCGEVV